MKKFFMIGWVGGFFFGVLYLEDFGWGWIGLSFVDGFRMCYVEN